MGLGVHADDVLRIIDAVSSGDPVFYLGSSIGALIGLELVSRHPWRVRRLIAHEPPISALLDDAQKVELVALQEEVERVHRTEGAPAAMAVCGRARRQPVRSRAGQCPARATTLCEGKPRAVPVRRRACCAFIRARHPTVAPKRAADHGRRRCELPGHSACRSGVGAGARARPEARRATRWPRRLRDSPACICCGIAWALV
jgi:pimeloyl-ACP methyl ester carboxylesterase